MNPRILLVDGDERGHYYNEIRAAMAADWLDPITPAQVESLQSQIDLALVSDEYWSRSSAVVCQLVEHRIPTLHIVDGIAEWRNTWENPRSLSQTAGPPMFQPILCHKIACLGRSQARLFESWGNLGKCEVVGAPRLDALMGQQPRRREGAYRILVMTAKTPGFTPPQIASVKRSLLDLQQWFTHHPQISGVAIEPIWRVTTTLADELGLHSPIQDLTGKELASVLQQVDAVITTPSTAMLEAMLCGLPVALLDYTNSPHFVPATWTITAAEHLDQVLPELVQPPAAKLLYQDTLLHDALECRTPATPRLVTLIQTMVAIAQSQKSQSQPLVFPRRILPDEQDGHHLPEERFDLQQLYPHHPVFAQMDRLRLQTELIHLRIREKRLQELIVDSTAWGRFWITLRALRQSLVNRWRPLS